MGIRNFDIIPTTRKIFVSFIYTATRLNFIGIENTEIFKSLEGILYTQHSWDIALYIMTINRGRHNRLAISCLTYEDSRRDLADGHQRIMFIFYREIHIIRSTVDLLLTDRILKWDFPMYVCTRPSTVNIYTPTCRWHIFDRSIFNHRCLRAVAIVV